MRRPQPVRLASPHRTACWPASLIVGALLASALPAAHAADINTVGSLTQAEFRLLSEDLGAVASFKPLIPAESMGLTGFDIGVGTTATQLANRSVWQAAAAGNAAPSSLAVPFVRVHKGLPFNIDVGASLAAAPSTNIRVTSGELRWAFVPGGTLTPALAVRASVSQLSGVDQLGLQTVGLDVSISKGFAFFTPYAGVGTVGVKSKPAASTGLASESFNEVKVFAGANVNLGLINFVLEADRTGDATSYGVKVGFRF
jgi:hypothetical protein